MPAQIFYGLSEGCTTWKFPPSDIGPSLAKNFKMVTGLVVEHGPYLPRMRRQQACDGATVLLMVRPVPDQASFQPDPMRHHRDDGTCCAKGHWHTSTCRLHPGCKPGRGRVVSARQAPSLALLAVKSLSTAAERDGCYRFFRTARFGNLLSASLAAVVDGQLPGDLGDTPKAVDTGEHEGKHRLS